jgi:uncharacterized membrane protein
MNLSPDVPPPRRGWTDDKVDLFVGNLLRYGVMTAAVLALVGGVPYLWTYWNVLPNYRIFHGVPTGLNTVHGILAGVRVLDSRAIIQLGLLLLIATPITRVAFSLFAFVKQRDKTYVVVTAIVLGILLWSFSGGVVF